MLILSLSCITLQQDWNNSSRQVEKGIWIYFVCWLTILQYILQSYLLYYLIFLLALLKNVSFEGHIKDLNFPLAL